MTLALVLGLILASALGFLAWRGTRVWLDAGQLGQPPSGGRRLAWALWGALVPSHYWWDRRLAAMSAPARQALLARETAKLGLSRADAQRCPLCGTEIPGAWTLNQEGQSTMASGPVECPACDFRLDSCRHCKHFMPGGPQGAFQLSAHAADITSGRCGFYKRSQPVEQTTTPDMARRLKERGYDRVRAPMQIQDSMLRPDFCRAFAPDPRRIKASGIDWPGPRRTALLHLLEASSGTQGHHERPEEEN
ncbi:MAG: hypothetical protein P8129_09735 [Anaerolineae bacterium]